MAKVNAVILAAGQSTRMGARNKLLLEIGGMPMIARVVCTYLQTFAGTLTVVTGFEQDRVAAALRGMPIRVVHNPDFADGQQTSVVAGLSQINEENPTVLGLGDQPALTTDDLAWLVAQHTQTPSKITIPHTPQGARGNPIVIPNALRAQMLAFPRSPGCRKFTRQNPDLVRKVETSAPGFFADIDTPQDYARHQADIRDTIGAAQ